VLLARSFVEELQLCRVGVALAGLAGLALALVYPQHTEPPVCSLPSYSAVVSAYSQVSAQSLAWPVLLLALVWH
jgi:hypothetical protein